ncbi:MAG: PEP-CTERM sorting domain-containing protein [Planctomycetes bacterium]|nr:PEP-CTERM sorting domain-containing protein [Planctomycetota bacterium]
MLGGTQLTGVNISQADGLTGWDTAAVQAHVDSTSKEVYVTGLAVTAVPEPVTLGVMAVGGMALLLLRRRRGRVG